MTQIWAMVDRLFRRLERSIPRLEKPPRPKRQKTRFNFVLRRRRLRHRTPAPPRSSTAEILIALAFAGVALGFFARFAAPHIVYGRVYFFLPFAGVALLGIWTSRLTTHRKILWSIPALAFAIPFLPLA